MGIGCCLISLTTMKGNSGLQHLGPWRRQADTGSCLLGLLFWVASLGWGWGGDGGQEATRGHSRELHEPQNQRGLRGQVRSLSGESSPAPAGEPCSLLFSLSMSWRVSMSRHEDSPLSLNCCMMQYYQHLGFPGGSHGKESACNAGDLGSILEWERSPGEEHGYPVFLPGESHGQRSLVGYSPWGHKELDMTEQASLSLSGHLFPSWWTL